MFELSHAETPLSDRQEDLERLDSCEDEEMVQVLLMAFDLGIGVGGHWYSVPSSLFIYCYFSHH
jgi:hypothetical protein